MSLSIAQVDHALAPDSNEPHPSPLDALENPNFGVYYGSAVSGLIARLGSPTSFESRQNFAQLAIDMAVMMHREEAMLRRTYANQSGAKQSLRIKDAIAANRGDSSKPLSRGDTVEKDTLRGDQGRRSRN